MMGEAMVMAREMARGQEPKSERLFAAVCAMGKALVRAVEMVRK